MYCNCDRLFVIEDDPIFNFFKVTTELLFRLAIFNLVVSVLLSRSCVSRYRKELHASYTDSTYRRGLIFVDTFIASDFFQKIPKRRYC